MQTRFRSVRLSLPALVTLGLLASACGGSTDSSGPTEDAVVVRLAGSGTTTPVVEFLAERFMETHENVSFAFESGTGSGGGIQGVADGTLDLGLVNRSLDDDEAAMGVEHHPFARDAMIFAVNEPNDVAGVSTEDVQSLYGGAITDWSDLGAESRPVVLLGRDADESATKLFFGPLMDGTEVAPTMAVLARSSEMTDALATTPGAIGFTTLGSLTLGEVPNVKPVALDGAIPGSSSLADGTYPWSMTLGVVSPGDATPDAVEEFIEFLTSTEAQEILAEYGYAPAS